ncbi:hypothetical protein VFPFJ_04028 [Purpureocillium lilacinum]|uniref:Uncharacterized protein n=1 Tax=Purpureocillium lilacinum TaxID=33203 RepID=A0A179HRL6_PURLI|nr:hypothetical protein VFPFJ_04028 [Purpureocillium lilacinum]OAQ92288.1 hypothetical protein VFPFJ_04028 [Purpureocillium lilacinum]
MLQQLNNGATGLKCRVCPALATAPRIDGTGVGLRGSTLQFVDGDVLLGNQVNCFSGNLTSSSCEVLERPTVLRTNNVNSRGRHHPHSPQVTALPPLQVSPISMTKQRART